MGKNPELIRMSGEIRREVHYREPPGVVVLGGECRGGRKVERNEYVQGGHQPRHRRRPFNHK